MTLAWKKEKQKRKDLKKENEDLLQKVTRLEYKCSLSIHRMNDLKHS